MKHFETERLLLTPSCIEDASFYLELLNTPKWLQNIGDRNVKSIEDSKAYIEQKMIPQLEKLGFSNYTVIRKSDNVKLGCCGLYDREGIDGFDIGFAFLPAYEKMGYAYESASKLKDIAVTQFKIKKISAITILKNEPSKKLLEKLDFKFLKFVTIPNNDEKLMLYEYKTNS